MYKPRVLRRKRYTRLFKLLHQTSLEKLPSYLSHITQWKSSLAYEKKSVVWSDFTSSMWRLVKWVS